MKKNKTAQRVLATGFLAALAQGCASLQDPPKFSIQQCAAHQSIDNIEIGIEPFDTKKESERVFHWNIPERGYIPIYTRIQNNSETPIIYKPTECYISDAQGRRWNTVPGGDIIQDLKPKPSAGRTAGIIFAFVVSPIGAAAGATVADIDFKRIQNHYDNIIFSKPYEIKPREELIGFTAHRRPEAEKGEYYNADLSALVGSTFHLQYEINNEQKEARLKLTSPRDGFKEIKK